MTRPQWTPLNQGAEPAGRDNQFPAGDEGDDDDVDTLLLHVSPTKDLLGPKAKCAEFFLAPPSSFSPVYLIQ